MVLIDGKISSCAQPSDLGIYLGKDIDFDQGLIEIHNSKGDKSRFAPLPKQLVEPLRKMVEARRSMHERDVANGEASVWLPHALEQPPRTRI